MFPKYGTRDRGQRKFAVDIARAAGEGYVNRELPMTEVKGRMCGEKHQLAMVHMIYTIVRGQSEVVPAELPRSLLRERVWLTRY